MIALLTDSGSMVPDHLRHAYGIEVVPLTVVLDDVAHLEGVDLDAEEFYERLGAGASVSTSAPSPGQFLLAYRRLASRGADAVLAVLTGSVYSSTTDSARLAAAQSPVTVDIVDTGQASFPVGLAAWAAAEALAGGADLTTAVVAAERAAASAASVFVVGAPERTRHGGRLGDVARDLTPTSILELGSDGLRDLGAVDGIEAALDAMVDHVGAVASESRLRAGIGHAARADLADDLERRLHERCPSMGPVRYEIGPSVGAHTGAGTVGVVWVPEPR